MINFFENRTLLIATMHGKERVIGPVFKNALHMNYQVLTGFNTDDFGTFSGEIERTLNPIETARKKCEVALDMAGADIGISSEGSFGPHPSIPFVQVNEEFLFLIDRKNKWEFWTKHVSMNAHFYGKEIQHESELVNFAEKTLFPAHGLIVKDRQKSFRFVNKDAQNISELIAQFQHCKKEFGQVYMESDLRAFRNPTRMKVIEETSLKLIEKLKNGCPSCQTPGFDVVDVQLGLPCEACRFPTESIQAVKYQCQHCAHENWLPRKDKKKCEDPMYCKICNP